MEKFKKALVLLLAVLTVLPLAACGGNEFGTETETESGEQMTVTEPYGYLERYSDNDAAAEWLNKNISGTDVPPVYFKIDGEESTALKWTKKEGEPVTVTDYPESDSPANRTYREITYTCSEKQIEVVLTLTSYPNYPVVEYDSYIVNLSKKNSGRMTDIKALNAAVTKYDSSSCLHYNTGSLCEDTDFQPHTASLSKRTTLFTQYGRPTNEYLPYFNIESADKQNGVIAVINWQGDWIADFSRANSEVYISAGQHGTDLVMLGEESLRVPGMVLMFYKNGDWQYGQNIWRRWMIQHNLMRYTGKRDFTQNVFVCSNFAGYESDMRSIKTDIGFDVAKKYNLVFELDAGWYDDCGNGWFCTGNWYPSSKYSDGKLEKMAKACRDNGIGFCLWLEPERIYYGTKQSRELKDNIIYLDGRGSYVPYSEYTSRVGGNYSSYGLVNYGKKEVEDYIVNLIDTTVKTYDMNVYRQDYNTDTRRFWDAYDVYESSLYGIARTGATQNHCCNGYVNAWRRIEELNPGLVFDCCASGGRRADLESMRYSFVHTKSDNWLDINSQQCQNFSAYSWYIFTGTAFTDVTSQYDIRTRLTLGIAIDCTLTQPVLNALKEWDAQQKYLYKDYYALSDYSLSDSANIALQFHDHENGEGMIMVYLRSGGVYTAKPKGLYPDKHYKIWDKDDMFYCGVMTGKELMENGFSAIRGYDSSAVMLCYEETDKELKAPDKKAELDKYGAVDLNEVSLVKNDEQALAKLWKDANIGENDVVFLSSDSRGSGGIYGISSALFGALPKQKGSDTEKDGWQTLDIVKFMIRYANKDYPIARMSNDLPLEVAAYIKETDGAYLLWLENSYALGDPESGWKTSVCQLKYVDPDGKAKMSEDFTLQVCAFDKVGGRDMQYVSYDPGKRGYVYRVSDRLYSMLKMTGTEKTSSGITWKEVDLSNIFLRALKTEGKIEDENTSYEFIGRKKLDDYRVFLYAGERDGNKYLWLNNTTPLKNRYPSGIWKFCVSQNENELVSFDVYMVLSSDMIVPIEEFN